MMMTNANEIKVNRIVNFLHKNDPQKLNSLKAEFKEYDKYLKPGIELETLDKTVETSEYQFRLEVSRAGLESVDAKADELIPILKKKLKRLNNVYLVSQIVVLLSGTAILSTIQKDFGNSYGWIKYIAPCLVLISSILTIWAKNKSESFLGGDKNLSQSANELIDFQNQSKFVLNEIKIIKKYFQLEIARTIIEKANTIAEKMNGIISKQ